MTRVACVMVGVVGPQLGVAWAAAEVNVLGDSSKRASCCGTNDTSDSFSMICGYIGFGSCGLCYKDYKKSSSKDNLSEVQEH
ncbi:hypothetical protein R6Q59_033008 [Mikania micrantha]